MNATATLRRPKKTQRIDWWRVISDLQQAGYSVDRIAAECLRSHGWVLQLKNLYAEPRFHDGMMLLGLWADATGHPRERAPKQSGF